MLRPVLELRRWEPRSSEYSCIYIRIFRQPSEEAYPMTASTMTAPRLPRAAVVAVSAWLALALLAGATGFLARLPFPGPQLIILTLLVATVAAGTAVPALRAWIDALPLRALIGINAFRFIGIAFLVLAARGQIAPVFAQRAGWATSRRPPSPSSSSSQATPARRSDAPSPTPGTRSARSTSWSPSRRPPG